MPGLRAAVAATLMKLEIWLVTAGGREGEHAVFSEGSARDIQEKQSKEEWRTQLYFRVEKIQGP